MDLQEAIKLKIEKLCKERNISKNKLATITGVRQTTISGITTGTTKSSQTLTISRLCSGLDISLKDFFDDELFYDLDDE